jgi:hypothetical protein
VAWEEIGQFIVSMGLVWREARNCALRASTTSRVYFTQRVCLSSGMGFTVYADESDRFNKNTRTSSLYKIYAVEVRKA